MLKAINLIYRNYGEKTLEAALLTDNPYKAMVRNQLINIERFLNIKYTDKSFEPMVHFLSIVLIRIHRGSTITEAELGDLTEIALTREYQSMLQFRDELLNIPDVEKIYMSLHLLSSNQLNQVMDDIDLPQLTASLWEFLNQFELQALVVLSEKKALLGKLINHFKPAYYRIKYKLPVDNVLYTQIVTKYRVLHDFVRQSACPLVDFFGAQLPDEELAYITLFIGGHLLEQESNEKGGKVIKAVILCPNGISISKLMKKSLEKLFPEFLFYPTNTVRDYASFVLPHDLVFSTIPVQSNRPVYVINEFLETSEKLNLRRRVMKKLFKLDFDSVTSTDILSVVSQYADVRDKEKLLAELDSLLVSGSYVKDDVKTAGVMSLIHALTPDVVDVMQGSWSWEELLGRSCELLKEQQVIGDDYLPKLIDLYKDQPSYISLRDNIVLPHLNPDDVKQKLGVSILIVEDGFDYCGATLYVVMLMTTPDKTSHLDILYDINLLSKSDTFIQKARKSKTKAEVLAIIKEELGG